MEGNVNVGAETNQDPAKVVDQTKDESAKEENVSLEDYLKDEANKAEYDAAIAEAVKAALEQQKADEAEAKRVEKLSAEERAAEKEAELAKREAAIAAAELKSEAIVSFNKENIPAGLADCLNYESRDTYEQTRKTVVEAFQSAVQAAVNDRIRGKNIPEVETGAVEKTETLSSAANRMYKMVHENQARR